MNDFNEMEVNNVKPQASKPGVNKVNKVNDLEYDEDIRARVVAAAFGPVLDKMLREDTDNGSTDGWPKIWSPISPTKLKFTRLTCPRPKYGIPADSKFQEPVDLKASLHNFRVYVNDTEYFMSNLPHVYSKWSSDKMFNENGLKDIRKTNFDYKTEPYYAMICGAYIASHLSGISLLNLFDKSAGNLISSFVRYHFYYQIRKFMHQPKLIDQYDVSEVKKYIPFKLVEEESIGTDGDGNMFVYMATTEHSGTDYRSFIAYHSEGLTPIGQKLFQESLESFNYSVLGAEARTRWSIVGKGAKSSQTQDVFRKIVEDTIIQSSSTVLISNMRKSIQATNVVLNLAVVPNVILMPSNFVILSKKIKGYNNVLTTATEDMVFGVNKDVNYDEPDYNNTNNAGTSSNSDNSGTATAKPSTTLPATTTFPINTDTNDQHYGYDKTNTQTASLQLPITFFLSLAIGVGASVGLSRFFL